MKFSRALLTSMDLSPIVCGYDFIVTVYCRVYIEIHLPVYSFEQHNRLSTRNFNQPMKNVKFNTETVPGILLIQRNKNGEEK